MGLELQLVNVLIFFKMIYYIYGVNGDFVEIYKGVGFYLSDVRESKIIV